MLGQDVPWVGAHGLAGLGSLASPPDNHTPTLAIYSGGLYSFQNCVSWLSVLFSAFLGDGAPPGRMGLPAASLLRPAQGRQTKGGTSQQTHTRHNVNKIRQKSELGYGHPMSSVNGLGVLRARQIGLLRGKHIHGEWVLFLAPLAQGGHTKPAFSIVYVSSAASICVGIGCCSLRPWHREITKTQCFRWFLCFRPQAYAWRLGVVPCALGTGTWQKTSVFYWFLCFRSQAYTWRAHGVLCALGTGRSHKTKAFYGFCAFGPNGARARRYVRELPAQENSSARPPAWRAAYLILLAFSASEPGQPAAPQGRKLPLVEACAKIARVNKCNRQFLHSPKTCHFIPELSTADFRLQAEWKGRCHKHARVAGVILGWR